MFFIFNMANINRYNHINSLRSSIIFNSVKSPEARKYDNHCFKSKVANWWDMSQLRPKDLFFKCWIKCIHLEIRKPHIKNLYLWLLLRTQDIWQGQAPISTQHKPAGPEEQLPTFTRKRVSGSRWGPCWLLITGLACTCFWTCDPYLHILPPIQEWPFWWTNHMHSITFICNFHPSLISCKFGKSQPSIRN